MLGLHGLGLISKLSNFFNWLISEMSVKENLRIEEIEALFGIDDDQAELSDINGDSDAEDAPDFRSLSTSSSPFASPRGHLSKQSNEGIEQNVTANDAPITSEKCNDSSASVDFAEPGVSKQSPPKRKNDDVSIGTVVDCEPGTSEKYPKRRRIITTKYTDLEIDQTECNLFSDDSDADPTYEPGMPSQKKKMFPFLLHNKALSKPNYSFDSDSEVEPEPSQVSKGEVSEQTKSHKPKGKNITKITTQNEQTKNKGKGKTTNTEESPYKWEKSYSSPKTFDSSKFDQPFGPTTDCSMPLDSFSQFLDDNIMQHMVDQSNMFACQQGHTLDMDVRELKCFIGMLIIMGFHDLPSMRDFWSTNPNFRVERIASLMPVKRFLKILRFLHLNDNSTMPKRGSNDFDKLYKLRPLIDHLNEKCKTAFQTSRYLSVDESMIAFKGRSKIKQYMPKKPIKRGFKVWVIACAKTGFVRAFDIYTGKKDGDPTKLLGEKVVLSMCKGLEQKFYTVHFDNFFSSVPLAETLLSLGIFSCGTMRADRKHFPTNFTPDKNMSQGDFEVVQYNDLTMSKWKDHGSKAVSVVSNYHNGSETAKVLRGDNLGHRKEVVCPKSIADYNERMGGVDLFDSMMSHYNISWKSRKWWIKVWYYLIELAIVNSYVCYKSQNTAKKRKGQKHVMFRSELADSLIGDFCSRKRPGPSVGTTWGRKKNRADTHTTVKNSIRLANVGNHVPIVGTYRRCSFCSTKEKQKRSNMICSECNVALCKPCFEPFHRR